MISVSVNLNIPEAINASGQGAATGLTKGAERLRALSVPLTPMDRGDLRSMTAVTPASVGNLESKVSNSLPYAVRQHEELGYRHEAGQAKYLEQPARENAREIGAIIGAEIRRELRS